MSIPVRRIRRINGENGNGNSSKENGNGSPKNNTNGKQKKNGSLRSNGSQRSAGRPKAIIDWKKVDLMLKAHCSGTSIAETLGINKETLYDAVKREKGISFSEYSQQQKEVGRDHLKLSMFKKAINGSNTMLIWLSKQYLGMSDKTQFSVPEKLVIDFIEDDDTDEED